MHLFQCGSKLAREDEMVHIKSILFLCDVGNLVISIKSEGPHLITRAQWRG